MIVVDASAAFAAAMGTDGFAVFNDEQLVAPALLWSEVRSALHEAAWRGDLTREQARQALANLERGPLQMRNPARLGERAFDIADRLGWAKTYDAEYLALAAILACAIATLDRGVSLAADQLGLARLIFAARSR